MPLYLLDANILIRQVDRRSPQSSITRQALTALRARGDGLATTVQSLMEFWVVATRPSENNGLGRTPDEAEKLLSLFEALYPSLPESADLYREWRRLVTAYGSCGKTAHDARYVAAMKTHGEVTHLLTFNTADFKRYVKGEGISVVAPADI